MATIHPEPPKVGDLLKHIGDDVKTIATTEIELGRRKMGQYFERTIAKASVVILGAFVALIGLAMLCMVVVVVLEPVIPQLWLRLLMMAILYLGVGGGASVIYAKRVLNGPDLDNEVDEVGQTFDAIQAGLSH
ncbi:MAG: phage holin family protein [Kofleriaceae bacterium]